MNHDAFVLAVQLIVCLAWVSWLFGRTHAQLEEVIQQLKKLNEANGVSQKDDSPTPKG